MKKIFILCSILSIFLSITLIKNCNEDIYCCEDQHTSTSHCLTCSSITESTYDPKSFLTNLILIPTLMGEIFFSIINTDTIKVITTLDRPPSLILS